MAWCGKCKYGSMACSMVKCPQCGGTEILNTNPLSQARKPHRSREHEEPSQPLMEKFVKQSNKPSKVNG